MKLIESYLPRVINDLLWVEATPHVYTSIERALYCLNLPLMG